MVDLVTHPTGGYEYQVTQEDRIAVGALSSYLTAAQVADYLGIDRATFFRLLQRDKELLRLYRKGKAKAIGLVAKSLVTNAINGDTVAAKFILSTQGGWTAESHRTDEDEIGLLEGDTEAGTVVIEAYDGSLVEDKGADSAENTSDITASKVHSIKN